MTPPSASDTAIGERRKLLQAHGVDLGDLAEGRLGIAFSGGGIRSATISLGVAQALAAKDRLLDFDLMSTVSGGGYIGSFLRSLFLPQSVRGSGAGIEHRGSAQSDTDFALAVLRSEPQARLVSGTRLTNPIHWLRENSRYLAPSGPTDYAVAATYILRNWLAMLFVFALPTLMFFAVIHTFVRVAAHFGEAFANGSWTPPAATFSLSVLFVVPALLLIASIVTGVAYWLTVYATDPGASRARGDARPDPAARVLVTAAVAFAAGLILLLVVHQSWDGDNLHWPAARWGWAHNSPFVGCMITPATILVASAALLALGAMAAAAVTTTGVIWLDYQEPKIGAALFGNELRRWLTDRNSEINSWLVATLLLALIDTIALRLVGSREAYGKGLAASSVLAAAGRWLIQKLGASFGKAQPGGAVGSFVARYIWQVAFVAAMLLWGGFALLLDVLIRQVAYRSDNWPQACALSLAILVVVMAMIGRSVGFINLSSLHSLYAARITRAYLGATNQERLAESALQDITGYQPKDVIRADIYQRQICAAPLHLMNITLNETISAEGSQLLERDRKGIPMVVAPEGIWIDAAAAQAAAGGSAHATPVSCSWKHFAASKAEALSVGQIAAISGAAFSSAMGARTTLGGALLFTYANIRLGYWWNRGTIRIASDPAAHRRDRLGWTGTFGYLLREMTARYRSTTRRVNLSDGGHFDNTGVYELLRRQTPTILLCDNGEDSGYHFEDLENLVRKARLDIGVSVEVASPVDVLATMGMGGAGIFLNGKVGDWRARARARNPGDPAFALLLRVRNAACVQVGTMVLLKPSLFGALPADVWGYAEQHVSFPHESTSDQFFTEAQWESYRKLGFMMMQQLLSATPHKENLFRRL